MARPTGGRGPATSSPSRAARTSSSELSSPTDADRAAARSVQVVGRRAAGAAAQQVGADVLGDHGEPRVERRSPAKLGSAFQARGNASWVASSASWRSFSRRMQKRNSRSWYWCRGRRTRRSHPPGTVDERRDPDRGRRRRTATVNASWRSATCPSPPPPSAFSLGGRSHYVRNSPICERPQPSI